MDILNCSILLVYALACGKDASAAPVPPMARAGESATSADEETRVDVADAAHTQKKKKKKKKKANSEDDDAVSANADQGLAEQAPDTGRSSALFPPWPPRPLIFQLSPIVDFAYGSYNSGASTVRKTSAETGLGAGVNGIPLVPGNPGLTAGVRAGGAFGNQTSVVEVDGDSESTNTSYRRFYGGLGLSAYYGFIRQELDFTRGKLIYSDSPDDVVQSTHVKHDLGLLFLSWLSGHYTLSYLRAYGADYADPLLIEIDHWLHARMAFSLLDFQLDVGPGMTQTTEFAAVESGTEKRAEGRTDDLRLQTSAHLFWKLGASGSARYVYAASRRDLGELATTRLPEQGLHEPSSLAMPEDSFIGSAFVGISDLFYGLGVGWQYNIQILNLGEHNDTTRQTTKSQGFGLAFRASI